MDPCRVAFQDMMDEDLSASGAVTSGVTIDNSDSLDSPASAPDQRGRGTVILISSPHKWVLVILEGRRSSRQRRPGVRGDIAVVLVTIDRHQLRGPPSGEVVWSPCNRFVGVAESAWVEILDAVLNSQMT